MRYIETIRVEEGVPRLLSLHLDRVSRACPYLDTRSWRDAIPSTGRGVEKCRIVYDEWGICDLSIAPYTPRIIRCLLPIEVETIDYNLKYEDRSALDQLKEGRATDEEIIIVQKGLLTDTTYSNIVLTINNELFTPQHPLLEGVMRRYLIETRQVTPKDLTVADLYRSSSIQLINAMMPLGTMVYESKQIL